MRKDKPGNVLMMYISLKNTILWHLIR
ncbi:hypothetical protein A6R68_17715 [Neotoma lepida]|uniref:Uncharacterized protein n=1 Tax=Neotoma lepida TaxID=56216 RepID=A0A1A6HC28_NEOLE|nr:hypothetical protein A6R68_17715 [Neotoma lepida]